MGSAERLVLHFPEPLSGLIGVCETRCVTGCCNLDAYEVAAAHLIPWMTATGLPAALAAVAQLERELAVAACHAGPVHGHDMLLCWEWDDAAEFLNYFDGWRTEVRRALVEVGGPTLFRPEWRTAGVQAITAGIVADRDFSRLPVLADALEDAGCDGELVLAHLRGSHRHGWFCWVTDLLAGN